MKRICFYTVLLLLILGISTQGFSQQTVSDFNKLSWLEGNWVRTNVKAGRSGSEHWKKISENEWQGMGIAMKGTDTSFIEKIKLVLKDGTIYYVADVPENKGEVLFKLTQLDENGFVCENPTHDFPKKIEYHKTGNALKATISGDGKSIDYLFEKK